MIKTCIVTLIALGWSLILLLIKAQIPTLSWWIVFLPFVVIMSIIGCFIIFFFFLIVALIIINYFAEDFDYFLEDLE